MERYDIFLCRAPSLIGDTSFDFFLNCFTNSNFRVFDGGQKQTDSGHEEDDCKLELCEIVVCLISKQFPVSPRCTRQYRFACARSLKVFYIVVDDYTTPIFPADLRLSIDVNRKIELRSLALDLEVEELLCSELKEFILDGPCVPNSSFSSQPDMVCMFLVLADNVTSEGVSILSTGKRVIVWEDIFGVIGTTLQAELQCLTCVLIYDDAGVPSKITELQTTSHARVPYVCAIGVSNPSLQCDPAQVTAQTKMLLNAERQMIRPIKIEGQSAYLECPVWVGLLLETLVAQKDARLAWIACIQSDKIQATPPSSPHSALVSVVQEEQFANALYPSSGDEVAYTGALALALAARKARGALDESATASTRTSQKRPLVTCSSTASTDSNSSQCSRVPGYERYPTKLWNLVGKGLISWITASDRLDNVFASALLKNKSDADRHCLQAFELVDVDGVLKAFHSTNLKGFCRNCRNWNIFAVPGKKLTQYYVFDSRFGPNATADDVEDFVRTSYRGREQTSTRVIKAVPPVPSASTSVMPVSPPLAMQAASASATAVTAGTAATTSTAGATVATVAPPAPAPMTPTTETASAIRAELGRPTPEAAVRNAQSHHCHSAVGVPVTEATQNTTPPSPTTLSEAATTETATGGCEETVPELKRRLLFAEEALRQARQTIQLYQASSHHTPSHPPLKRARTDAFVSFDASADLRRRANSV